MSGTGCFLFILRRFSLGKEREKASSTIFIVIADSLVVSPSEASESASDCQKIVSSYSGGSSRSAQALLSLSQMDGSGSTRSGPSSVASCCVVPVVELCSPGTFWATGLVWRLCSGGVFVCTLASPSILSTLSEMLCISERKVLWFEAMSSRSCCSSEAKSLSESLRWCRCFFLCRRRLGDEEDEDILTLIHLAKQEKRLVIDGMWQLI